MQDELRRNILVEFRSLEVAAEIFCWPFRFTFSASLRMQHSGLAPASFVVELKKWTKFLPQNLFMAPVGTGGHALTPPQNPKHPSDWEHGKDSAGKVPHLREILEIDSVK